MADPFAETQTGMDSPARRAAAVTPDDETDLPTVCRSLYVGTLGNLALVTVGGDTVTLASVSGWVPICAARVLETGTTADDIVAVW